MFSTLLLLGSLTAHAEVPLNQATADELSSIDGISEAQAGAIVALRGDRGRLGSIEALRILPGLDDSSLDALRRNTTMDLPVRQSGKSFKTVAQVMDAFSSEPDIRAVQKLTMDYSHTHARQVEQWLAASRNAAYLPEVQLRYYYYDRLNEGYEYAVDDQGDAVPQIEDADTDKDNVYQVTLKWRLDDLVMSSERIRVISEAQDVVKLRDKVLRQVTQIFFDRRRLQVELMLSPGGDLRSQVEDEIRLMELTAELDALTGGQFSRAVSNN
jgi:hypothetical protein